MLVNMKITVFWDLGPYGLILPRSNIPVRQKSSHFFTAAILLFHILQKKTPL
jgi:hypothetical protein